MRKIVFVTLLMLCIPMWAGLRTESKMRKIAASKLLGSTKEASKMEVLKSTSSYYIFGKEKQGFVIVSTNNSATPVLGYSSSEYKENDMPPAFKRWLKAVETSLLDEKTSTPYTVTPNFLPTKWGQSDPFNYLCPEVNNTKTPCGCIATAMGQIMYYYQYPSQGVGNGYYTLETTGEARYPDEIKGEYRWDLMKTYYSNITISEEERLAVATLLKDAGVASHMHYDVDNSGTLSNYAALAFVNNFGYDANTIQYMQKKFYSKEEWDSIIYEELAAKRPILAGGYDSEDGGHAFVFSGVDEDGRIYVNWGWNGNADGFYEITALKPRYTSRPDLTLDFSLDNDIIYGIQPAQSEPDKSLQHSKWACEEPFTAEYQKIRNWLKVKTSFIYNISIFPFTGEIKLYCKSADGDETKDKIYTYLDFSRETVSSEYGYRSRTVTIKTTDLTPGKYYIYLVSQATDEATPQKVRCPGGQIQYVMTKEENGVLIIENDDTVDNISTCQPTPLKNPSTIYDLSGRKLNSIQKKGIYIQNGIKIIQ